MRRRHHMSIRKIRKATAKAKAIYWILAAISGFVGLAVSFFSACKAKKILKQTEKSIAA